MDEITKQMAGLSSSMHLHTESQEEGPSDRTDLSIDCLADISGTSSIKDLVNAVEADGRTITAARNVFREVYSTSTVELSNEFFPKTEDTSMSVKIIEHFGDMIEELKVIYHKKYIRFNDMLDDIILDKCLKSLTEIEIENGDQLVFHKITQPFEKLRRIRFVSSEIPDVILYFEKWFPNAHTLELMKLKIEKSKNDDDKVPQTGYDEDSDSENSNAFAKCYPTVEHFAISNVPKIYDCESRVGNEHIQKFIELNPQLKSVLIESDDIDRRTKNKWQKVSCKSYDGIPFEQCLSDCIQANLPNLENFHLIWKARECNESFHFKKLETLTIECEIQNGYFHVSTDKVNVLNIIGNPDGYCSDLIEWNKTATIINITGAWCDKRDVMTLFEQIIELQNLKELRFAYNSEFIQKKHIIFLLWNCRCLDKLTLQFDCGSKLIEKFSKEFNVDSFELSEFGWNIISSQKDGLVMFVYIPGEGA